MPVRTLISPAGPVVSGGGSGELPTPGPAVQSPALHDNPQLDAKVDHEALEPDDLRAPRDDGVVLASLTLWAHDVLGGAGLLSHER